jgi:hypothetical protein
MHASGLKTKDSRLMEDVKRMMELKTIIRFLFTAFRHLERFSLKIVMLNLFQHLSCYPMAHILTDHH